MPEFITTDPVLLVVGLFYTVIGLSLVVSPAPWRRMIEAFQTSEIAMLMGGMFALLFGLLVTLFYASWDGIGRGLLTVFGYIALVEAFVMLFMPRAMQKFVGGGFYQGMFKVSGFVSIAFGLAFLVL